MANERYGLNKELAQMLKGGVIMDVTTPEQARIAQEAGACAVMALERIPADIRAAGGVSRMSAVSDISQKHRFWKPLRLTILMRVKYCLRQMMYIILTRPNSRFHLYVVPRIWGKRSEELMKVHP